MDFESLNIFIDENWIFLLFFIIGAVVLIIDYFWAKKRTEALTKLAKENGFEFAPQSELDVVKNHKQFHLFSLGHSKTIINRFHKTNPDEPMIFGYQFTKGSGKDRRRYAQTVVLFKNKRDLPIFEMRPEKFYHKMASTFGYQDIDIKAYPAFSKQYLLRGKKEEDVTKLFNINVIHHLEKTAALSIESNGDSLIVYLKNKRAKADEILKFYSEAQIINRLFNG